MSANKARFLVYHSVIHCIKLVFYMPDCFLRRHRHLCYFFIVLYYYLSWKITELFQHFSKTLKNVKVRAGNAVEEGEVRL